ncbi:MAG TPA: hypothetical protein VK846_14555 [Candidatus Limnocylindria bacterium]|nr:hypothetical protein [Candidatus Limnocylindria bacterium]
MKYKFVQMGALGLKKIAQKILDIPQLEFYQPKAGKGGFLEIRHILESIEKVARIIVEAKLQCVPVGYLRIAQQRIETLHSNIERAVHFDGLHPDISTRHDIIHCIREHFAEVFTYLGPMLAYESIGANKLESWSATADRLRRIELEMMERKREVDRLVENLREIAQKGGVTREAIHFSQSSKRHRNASWWWLAASASIGGAMIWYAFDLIHPQRVLPVESVQQAILHYIPRFIFFSIAITAWIFCLRNYNSAKHNQTVNEHRAVSLSTFEVFAGGTKNPAVTDAVLLEASRCAFSAQPTGFLRSENEGPQNQSSHRSSQSSEGRLSIARASPLCLTFCVCGWVSIPGPKRATGGLRCVCISARSFVGAVRVDEEGTGSENNAHRQSPTPIAPKHRT